MASLENGYTRVANEILEQIHKAKLNGTQRNIIDIVWRYTYGFQRKEHDLSVSFIANAIQGNYRVIQRELNRLIEMNIIIVKAEATFKTSRVIAFNKNVNSWVISNLTTNQSPHDKKVESGHDQSVSKVTTNQSPKKESKEIYKESSSNFSKTEKPKPKSNDNLYNENFEKLWKLYPNKKGKAQVSNTKKKEIYKLGDEFERCISRYKEDVEAQRKNGFKELNYKNGSTFFRSGYVDYLDENYKVEEEKKPTRQLKMVYRDLLGGEGIEPDTGH